MRAAGFSPAVPDMVGEGPNDGTGSGQERTRPLAPYNFIFRHGTLRMPPVMKAKVTDHVWTYEELVELIDRTPVG
jgi:hypothetical protein